MKTKKKSNNLKIYSAYRSNVKGKIFEIVLETLLSKAGFRTDVYTDQLTKNQKRLHGRGATYDPDYLGQFAMGIPFINPIMIVAEAKNYNFQISLAKVREFLGSYIDFSQYVRIDTKKGGEERYAILNSTRFTYCPIYFSVKGFQKSAEALMFAHGINYISYENSEIVKNIFVLMDGVLSELRFNNFKKEDLALFNNLESIPTINPELKKRNFDKNFAKFRGYLQRINSLIGVIDFKYPVHILYERSVTASFFRKVKFVKDKNGKYTLVNTAGRKFGEVSITDGFIKDYVLYAKKKDIIDRIFIQIDVISQQRGLWGIRQLLIDDDSKKDLISPYLDKPQLEEV